MYYFYMIVVRTYIHAYHVHICTIAHTYTYVLFISYIFRNMYIRICMYMYVHTHIRTYYYIQYANMYTYLRILSVSSSVTNAQVIMITAEDATNITYSITVTCTIHRDSDVDMCEVIATGNGLTLKGEQTVTEHMTLYVCTYYRDYHICMYMYTVLW